MIIAIIKTIKVAEKAYPLLSVAPKITKPGLILFISFCSIYKKNQFTPHSIKNIYSENRTTHKILSHSINLNKSLIRFSLVTRQFIHNFEFNLWNENNNCNMQIEILSCLLTRAWNSKIIMNDVNDGMTKSF